MGIRIANQAELEKADFVICMPLPDPKHFQGNIETECGICGEGIYHRPYMPKAPLKICANCFINLKHD